MIWAEPETNALVITAAPKQMRQINAIIDKIDIRRMQVLVEAIIADVTEDKSAELGVNWAAWSNDNDTRIPIGGFIQPVGGTSIVDLARLIQDPTNAATAGISAPTGTTLGIGRIAASGVNFAAMLRAMRSDARHEHHREALHHHDGQPGGAAQSRAGSAVHHRFVLEHRHAAARTAR